MNNTAKRFSSLAIAILIIAVTVLLTVFAYTLGDIDGDGVITNADVVLLMKYIDGEQTLEQSQLNLADYNGDGVINILDIISIKRVVNSTANVNDGWTIGIY